jgi:hypothetical protein
MIHIPTAYHLRLTERFDLDTGERVYLLIARHRHAADGKQKPSIKLDCWPSDQAAAIIREACSHNRRVVLQFRDVGSAVLALLDLKIARDAVSLDSDQRCGGDLSSTKATITNKDGCVATIIWREPTIEAEASPDNMS